MTFQPNDSQPTKEKSDSVQESGAADEARILNHVKDQHGAHWILYGTASRSIWFSVQELHTNERDVFARLSGAGNILLTPRSKNRFKELIEGVTTHRSAIVAAKPGWCGQSFVFGDGTIICPKNCQEKIIVAFEINPKFSPAGSSREWTRDVGRVVAGQPLPLVMLAYSFVPALLRFAPEGILNPQIELVGGPETGKSTVAVLAASVWAGNPNSDAGGGENWNLTLASLDPLKASHSDMLLMLDEANLAGGSVREQANLVRAAAFRVAATGGRRRLTDPATSSNVRVALLSTSNEPRFNLVQASNAVAEAMSSRMVTIMVDGTRNGVLDSVPDGYETTREAMQRLRRVCARNYGHVGRNFVGHLVEAASKDEDRLRDRISKLMASFLDRLRDHVGTDSTSERVNKVFAMTYAAGILARKWGLLPEEWGRLKKSCLAVFDRTQGRSARVGRSSALERVRKYVRDHANAIDRAESLSGPVTFRKFKSTAGYLLERDGKTIILIPSERFRSEFEDHESIMKELRRFGQAKTERGKKPKLTVKAPKGICSRGRVYWIELGTY